MANETYESLNKRLINIRRDLHEHPELSGEEYETTNKIRRWLEEEGITVLDVPKLQTG
ncbi:amidohydrolase, partial [Priestia megaterium]